MKLSFVLAFAVISSCLAYADGAPQPSTQQPGPTVAENSPAPELLTLEKALIQEQEATGSDRPTPAQYKDFVAKFRAKLDDTMAHVAPKAANQSLHALILARLGDSGEALQSLDAALKLDSKNLDLSAAKAYVLYDQKDYGAAAAAANAILQSDPKNQDAMWLKHASEDRQGPALRLPGSPWGAGPETQGVVGAASDATDKPYTLSVPVGATPAPPNYTPSSEPDSPPEKKSPLVPLAAVGVLLWIGAALAARQAQHRAVDAAGQEGEKAVGKAAALAEHGKELIEAHPYAAGTAVIGAIALGAWLAAPIAGGPTLFAAGAVGAGAPVAGVAAATFAAPIATASGGAAALAFSISGDAKPNQASAPSEDSNGPNNAKERNPGQDKKLSSGEIERLKRNGYDIEELKQPHGRHASRYDLFKDPKTGDIYVKPKSGIGPGDPTNINLRTLSVP